MIKEGKDFSRMVMSDSEVEVFDFVTDLHYRLIGLIDDINEKVPPSRERSLVITKIQEANLWLNMLSLS